MYIKSVKISNFRKIQNLELELNQYLNFIIGENDSGKTALIDALKFILGTVSSDYLKIEEDDFYNNSREFSIEVQLTGFTPEQALTFYDWGGEDEKGNFCMKLKYFAWIKDDKIFSRLTAGPTYSDEEGKALEPEVRVLLNAIYLRPLRDAQQDLKAGKNSRLSKILGGHQYFKGKERDHEFVKRFETLNNAIREYFSEEHDGKSDIINDMINNVFEEFMGKEDAKKVLIDTGNPDTKNILEKLSLEYKNNKKPGLGTSNLLFIASELVLLNERTEQGLGVALIEELEAHIHPQKQLTLIDYLQKKSEKDDIQMFITSHSPNIASQVDLGNVIICKNTKFYSLREGTTLLETEDYRFLQRFLDVTKADLFFARGIIFVEGIAEAVLLPTIAKLFDINLHQKGVSIINLNGLSFERYLKIFVGVDEKKINYNYLGIIIACITDRDGKDKDNSIESKIKSENSGNIPNTYLKTTAKGKNVFDIKKLFEEKISDGKIEQYFSEMNSKEYLGIQEIKYFYNNIKTLEFDLAIGSFFDDLLQARRNVQKIEDETDIIGESDKYKRAFALYQKVENLKGDFAQSLASIWENEMKDPTKKETLKEKFRNDPYVRYILKAVEHVSGDSILTK